MSNKKPKGSLIFTYATVAAGKSAQLICLAESYRNNHNVRVLVPEIGCVRDGECVKSRNGQSIVAQKLASGACPFELLKDESIDILFVDESQFLSAEQVLGLCRLVDECNVDVLAYGLRTDFKGNPFEGASFLMAWADEIIEMRSDSATNPSEISGLNAIIADDAERDESVQSTIKPGFQYIPVSRKEFNLVKNWRRNATNQ